MRLILALCMLVATGNLQAKERCEYNAAHGEEITFTERSDGGTWGVVDRFRSEPRYVDSTRLLRKDYAGRKGKILSQSPIEVEGTEYYRVMMSNCEMVYTSLLDGHLSMDVYTASELATAESFIGKKFWAKQYGVREPTLFTLDENVEYSLNDGEELTVTGVYTKSIGHSYGSHYVMLEAQDSRGNEGYYPFNSLYLFTSKPSLEELRQRRAKLPADIKASGLIH